MNYFYFVGRDREKSCDVSIISLDEKEHKSFSNTLDGQYSLLNWLIRSLPIFNHVLVLEG